MASKADERRDIVRSVLDGRSLAWFGIRGTDGSALLRLPEFEAGFAITAAPQAASLDNAHVVTLEEISGTRPDLDAYDLDLDASAAADEFRSQVRRVINRPSVIVTYRPSAFISALGFAMAENVTVAGPFADRQRAFEYKPWVESQLRARGVRVLPWDYVADQDQQRAVRMLRRGPLVLRSSRDSGGVGIALAHDADDLVANWPARPEHFVAVAPYFADALPLNVTGCVYADGTVGMHPASVQLIGIEGCTDRRFGYCGNDFGAVKTLHASIVSALDELVRHVGTWLAQEQYLGVFGIDALVHEGTLYFTEINARFQGSTALSALIAASAGEPDLLVEHLAAHLGLPGPTGGPGVADWIREQSPVAHLVVHHLGEHDVTPDLAALAHPVAGTQVSLLPPPGVRVEPGGVLSRITTTSAITEDGYSVSTTAADAISAVQGTVRPAMNTGGSR